MPGHDAQPGDWRYRSGAGIPNRPQRSLQDPATWRCFGDTGDGLLAKLHTDRGAVVSVKMFMNAAYGYHVHAEIVGREGTVATAEPAQLR